jgi:hypothetical protein
VKAVQDVTANDVDLETFTREDVEASLVRCPQQDASDAMVSEMSLIKICQLTYHCLFCVP